MKKLFLLLVLFSTSFYGQNETYQSYSYSYAYNIDNGWQEPIIMETKIEINFDKDKIVLSNLTSNQVLTNISLKENFTDENGYKGTTYFCQDKNGDKLEFMIMHETSVKDKKMIVLSYDKYLIAYDLYILNTKLKR